MPHTSDEESRGRDLAEVMDEAGDTPGSNVEDFLQDPHDYVEAAQKLAARWKLGELRAAADPSVPMLERPSGQMASPGQVLVRTVGLRRLSDEGVLLPPVAGQAPGVARAAVAVEVFVPEDRVGTDPARLPGKAGGVLFDEPVRHESPSGAVIHEMLVPAIPEPAAWFRGLFMGAAAEAQRAFGPGVCVWVEWKIGADGVWGWARAGQKGIGYSQRYMVCNGIPEPGELAKVIVAHLSGARA